MSKKKKRLSLVLEGGIYVVETVGEKEVSKEEVDGDVVLKLIIAVLEDYIATKG